MEPTRTSGRRSAGARKPKQRGVPYGSARTPGPARPSRERPSVGLRAAGGNRRPSKQPRGGLAGLGGVGRQKPARSQFKKASARLASRQQSKQSRGRAAAVSNLARGLMSQGSARSSKKGPAALAMAAAGAVGGVALARRRKAGSAAEGEATTDSTLHVSSEPVEAAGPRVEGATPPPPAAG